MASSSQSPLPPHQNTTALLRANLNRCHSTGSNNSRNKISAGGTGVSLFDSSKLRNIKANILQEISSKWEATFSDLQSGTTAQLAAGTGKTLLHDNPASGINTSTTSPMSVNRKQKMRSVYGQPEVEQTTAVCSSAGLQNGKQWSSLDSLDTYDSGNGGMGSTSTSCSDLRATESQHQHLCNKADVMVSSTKGRRSAGAAVCSSDLATSVESSDNEQELQGGYRNKTHARCPSSNSTSSGCSIDSQFEVDEMSREAKSFMRDFVKKIFSNSSSISLEEKASFGQYARSESGRVWFGRYITKERNENKRVSESTFYSLAQYFAIVLFECADADHFTPAKSLMNMCFTYYHQPASRPWSGGNSRSNAATNKNSNSNNNISNKQYLSSVLRDQPIWRSLRFWNAAFFDAVQTERVTFFESSRSADHHHRPPSSVMISSLQQDALDDWQFQANVTFGQLGTFTYQMHSFGLPKGLCLEFLRKQSTIANLTSEQIHLLIENIETMYKNGVA